MQSTGQHDSRLDRARGALLGLVIAEQQRAGSDGAQLTALATTILQIAELLGEAVDPHPGELARTIIDHALPDARYDDDLLALLAVWQRGVPVQIAASHLNVPDGVASDFAAAVLSPLAVRHADDRSVLLQRVSAYAGITHAHPVGVDGAVVLATAVAAALNGDDPLDAACAVAATLQLRGRLQAVRVLRSQRIRPGSLREHFDCGFNAAEHGPDRVVLREHGWRVRRRAAQGALRQRRDERRPGSDRRARGRTSMPRQSRRDCSTACHSPRTHAYCAPRQPCSNNLTVR